MQGYRARVCVPDIHTGALEETVEAFVTKWISDPRVRDGVKIAIGIVVILIVAGLVRRAASKYIVDPRDRYRVRKVIIFASYLAIVLLIAAVYSGKVQNLGITLGVAGAGAAVALQDVITSIAGWVVLSTGGIYRTGDRIAVSDITGDVIDIGVMRTTLMEIGDWVKSDLYSGRIIRFPNNLVLKDAVFNYSADFPFVWDEFTLPVKYGGDRAAAEEILNRVSREVVGDYAEAARSTWKQVARKYLIDEAQVEPIVTLVATDNWIEFTVRYVVDYRTRRMTRHKIFKRILDEIDKTNGRVEIASGTYAIVQAPPLEISIRDRKPEANGSGERSDPR